ncbi:MAG: hypothetical protein ABSA41_10365 [Terriglobia bacterium]
MTLWKELGIAVVGAGAAALAGAWRWRTLRRQRRKDPAEIERDRRLGVNACGRISTGRILELMEPVPGGPAGPNLLYEYEVAGATYAAAQDVSALPEIAAAAPFLPGHTANVKYDPKQPTNSILACEDWCGIFGLDRAGTARSQPAGDPAKPSENN